METDGPLSNADESKSSLEETKEILFEFSLEYNSISEPKGKVNVSTIMPFFCRFLGSGP